jgi:hypothetical protein
MSDLWKVQQPILLRARHQTEAEHQAKLMAQIARDTDVDTPIRVTSGRPAGDERTLRGIPAIGRNVAGAIFGTNPLSVVR